MEGFEPIFGWSTILYFICFDHKKKKKEKRKEVSKVDYIFMSDWDS